LWTFGDLAGLKQSFAPIMDFSEIVALKEKRFRFGSWTALPIFSVPKFAQ
jgi:hypothetical protein